MSKQQFEPHPGIYATLKDVKPFMIGLEALLRAE